MKKHPHLRLFAAVASLALFALPTSALAGDSGAVQDTITRSLQEFLAKNDDPAQHERFWADDLVYTSSMGEVTHKAEIMKAVSGAKSDPAQPRETYSAEDILVRPYGTTAALMFRLVRRMPDGKVQYYRNSGTLLLRNGQWQVVTWQATKVADASGLPVK